MRAFGIVGFRASGLWVIYPRSYTLGDIDPLNKAPFKRATRRVQKGPL